MKSGQTLNSPTVLGIFLLFAALCLPSIAISANFPSIHWVDICLPFILLLLYFNRSQVQFSKYHVLPFAMAFYVSLTIIIQAHDTTVSDYFEIYKWLKFGILLLFLGLMDFGHLQKSLPYLFFVLIALNLLHFFNFPGINQLLEEQYNGGLQIQFFGKNSLGEPAVKRMVGTMGNPNINALLFTFFSIIFLPIRFNKKQFGLFLTALTMVFFCQSRTSIVVILVLLIYLAIFHLHLWTRRQWLTIIGGLVLTYLFALMLATSFFQYSAYSTSLLDGTALYSGSLRGRFETWALLGQQILEYPIFGHGPYKQYFYSNRIYAENEYILMAWRYGIMGLVAYILVYLLPFMQLFRSKNPNDIPFVLLILVMLTSALTNNPFTERNIELLFCLALAWAFKSIQTAHAKKGE